MPRKKAERNRTIEIDAKEAGQYLKKCAQVKKAVTLRDIKDRVILGDFFETAKFLPKESVDLMIADPPYNLTKNYNGHVFNKKKKDEYEDYTRRWLEAALPLLKKDASVYVCCDWASSLIIGNVLMEYMTVRNRITWQREKGRGASANWKNGMEDIWFATAGSDYTFNLDAVKVRKKVIAPYRVDGKPKDWKETDKGNFRDTCPSNFWDDITVPFWSMKENTSHPAQKSEKLLAKLILASSDEGGVIFDPFLGSGSTAVTARKLGRHFFGTEIEPEYCVLAQKRLEDAKKNRSIQGFENGIFLDRNMKYY
ncbi:MAG: site-specific DNA-methyltransferase [Lachnospiraceae bacterium]|nr:site-specific DNA-methyltransferase [Lachnospiraceae bacterium]